MIPAQAVEAAAKKLYQRDRLNAWDKEDESVRRHYRLKALVALEAAAPHMLAGAWADGHDAGFTYGAFQGRVKETPNPYKPTP